MLKKSLISVDSCNYFFNAEKETQPIIFSSSALINSFKEMMIMSSSGHNNIKLPYKKPIKFLYDIFLVKSVFFFVLVGLLDLDRWMSK